MKNTEVAKIAKKITKKAFIPAYITPAGAIVAFNDDASILFTAEVEAALQDTSKTYTPAALDYTSKSGIFAGGEIATNTDCYDIPVDEFAPVCTVDVSILKHIANYASKDDTRPILTGLHIGGGYIEACDGFRATRYQIDTAPDVSINIPAAVLAFGGLKKAVTIEAGKKYARITSDTGAVFYTRLLAGNFINLEAIYDTNNTRHAITFNNRELLSFVDAMRGLKDPDNRYRPAPLLFKLSGNRLIVAFNSDTVNGYKEFNITGNDNEYIFTVAINPEYVYTALKGGADTINFEDNKNAAPVIFTESTDTGFNSLVLPIRFSPYEVEDIINKVKPAAPAEVIQDAPAPDREPVEDITADSSIIEAPAPVAAEDPTPDTAPDTSTPDAVEDPADDTPAPPAIPEAIYNAVYKAACMIVALKKRNYTPTPAAVDYSEAYAREHKDIINQMQKARGHIYTSGVELIAAVYTIQNGGVTA